MSLSKVPFLRHFVSSTLPASSSNELTHITQEMYKKNLELSARNKTLSILRKIDEIILSSVSDLHQIAQEVCSILVTDAEYKSVSIFLLEQQRQQLTRIGSKQSQEIATTEQALSNQFTGFNYIPFSFEQNIVVRAVRDRRVQLTTSLYDVLLHDHNITYEQAHSMQETSGIKLTVAFPLIVRGQLIGVMLVSFAQVSEEFSEYERDLLDRLVSVVGIALDNAMLYNEVQESNVKLKALDKLKDDFVSLASHELRTPMTAIKSYLWMALAGKGGQLTGKLPFYLQRAYDSTDRLIKLVNDMLNISRIESGRITIDIQRISLVKLAEDVIYEVMPRAEEINVKLKMVPAQVPDVVADPDKIKEVLINLIGNSLKFTPANGSITVSFGTQNGLVQTAISDTGAGIAPEDMGKLFQKFGFIQGSYTTNQTTVAGTGLGLYICKSIIELHEGKIAAESAGRSKGTTFRFTLPVYTQETFDRLKNRYKSTEGKEKVGLVHSQL